MRTKPRIRKPDCKRINITRRCSSQRVKLLLRASCGFQRPSIRFTEKVSTACIYDTICTRSFAHVPLLRPRRERRNYHCTCENRYAVTQSSRDRRKSIPRLRRSFSMILPTDLTLEIILVETRSHLRKVCTYICVRVLLLLVSRACARARTRQKGVHLRRFASPSLRWAFPKGTGASISDRR